MSRHEDSHENVQNEKSDNGKELHDETVPYGELEGEKGGRRIRKNERKEENKEFIVVIVSCSLQRVVVVVSCF